MLNFNALQYVHVQRMSCSFLLLFCTFEESNCVLRKSKVNAYPDDLYLRITNVIHVPLSSRIVKTAKRVMTVKV